jgi:hypothetical protein
MPLGLGASSREHPKQYCVPRVGANACAGELAEVVEDDEEQES